MRARVAGVVLAAGEGRRFGAVKQLATFRGVPLVRRAVDVARDAGADPIIVVLGAHASIISPVVGAAARVVVNDDWATGAASSVRAGLDAIGDQSDAALITTIDQPLVDATMLRALIDAFDPEHTIVAATYDDVLGIPVVVGRDHFAVLTASLSGDRGAGPWLRAHRGRVTPISLPAAAHDADTPEVLGALERGE